MTRTVKTILSVFVTDLAAYNAGELRGEWLELPTTEDEITECIERVTSGEDHEIFITDFESDIGMKAGEYDSIENLNEQAQEFEDLDEWEQDIAEAILECGAARDISEAVEMVDDCTLYSDCETLEDLARELVDDGAFGDIPQSIANYIDYEAIARDLNYDNYYETSKGVLYVS